jgi:hypothetical protein
MDPKKIVSFNTPMVAKKTPFFDTLVQHFIEPAQSLEIFFAIYFPPKIATLTFDITASAPRVSMPSQISGGF